MKKIILTSALLIIVLPMACKKEKKEEVPVIDNSNGEVTINFVNKVDNANLELSTALNKVWYKNQNNDSFNVSVFNYYISNVKLIAEDGSTYAEPESYHLIEQSNASSKSFSLKNIPAKKYVALSYTLGVDSIRNISGAQTNALDPANGMFWTWNSGYIFMKFEGEAPKSTSQNKSVIFHIGGYKGAFNGIKNNVFNLPIATLINGSNTKKLTLNTNLNELFKNPQIIDFSVLNFGMSPNVNTKKIADNYADMISLSKIE